MKKGGKPVRLEVFCSCGERLVKYNKGSGRRLVKVHADRIVEDYQNIFSGKLPENTDIYCKKCSARVATVKKINGKYVNKLNQGQIGRIKK